MKRNGFTLIELLLVFAIIGIVLAIAIPSCVGARKGKEAPAFAQLVGRSKGQLIATMGAPDGQVIIDDRTVAFIYSKTNIETNYSPWNRGGFKTMPVQSKTIFTVREDRVISWEIR